MQHIQGTSLGGNLEKSVPSNWDWSKNGGEYVNGRNFFSVHWEVQERDPNSIRLHVESPNSSIDPFLNDLKQEVVQAILLSDIASKVSTCGFEYEEGKKTSIASIKRYKSTEPFRVNLAHHQRKPTTEKDIAMVHEAVGHYVNQIVQKYSDRLDEHFRSY